MSRFSRIMVLLTVTAALGFMAQAASATSGAHFFSATSSVVLSGSQMGALQVSWDEAGVGQQEVDYTLHADASATYACINGGGNHPKAANKQSVNGPLDVPATPFLPQNGRVQGTLTTGPLGSNLVCPSGQSFVLACVSYSNIVLTDITNNVIAHPANVSKTFVNIGPPC
jgi:hypothetical protein